MMTLGEIASWIVNESKNSIPWPKGSKCAKGCGACCRQLVTVSPGEALRLAALVESMPADARARTRSKFEAAEKALQASDMSGTLAELNSPETSSERHYEIARDYFALQVACPFLDDESCSIHDQRPLICREYHVASDPSQCADPFANSVDVISAPQHLSEMQKLMDARLMGTESIVVIPLPLALRWAGHHGPIASDLAFEPTKVRTLWHEYKLLAETGARGADES